MTAVDEQEFAEAVASIQEAIAEYDQLPPETQRLLDAGIVKIRAKLTELLARADAKKSELDRARDAQAQQAKRDRKRIRDEAIPAWCLENLKPGMVVKVKSASRMNLRQVIEVFPAGQWTTGSFRGHHCTYRRTRDPVTRHFQSELVLGGYITDHVLTNVQGVVVGMDGVARANIVPIMDLVAGVNT
jgi:hypothetical protein